MADAILRTIISHICQLVCVSLVCSRLCAVVRQCTCVFLLCFILYFVLRVYVCLAVSWPSWRIKIVILKLLTKKRNITQVTRYYRPLERVIVNNNHNSKFKCC